MTLKNQKSKEIQILFDNLKLLHQNLRKKTKTEWNRVLPFEELLFDRWEKADFLKAKKESSIYHSSYIFGNVVVGRHTWIGPFTLLDGSGDKIKIGNYCSVSSGVQIYTHDTVNWSLTGGKASYEKGSVSIGDFCYLGPYSLITKGVRIGKCSIIGAHALVNSTIPPYSIVYGIPGKIVGRVKIKGKKTFFEYFSKK